MKNKYIQIRHWDYWYKLYDLGDYKREYLNSVEFNLTDDLEGEEFYFHLELSNLKAAPYYIDEYLDESDDNDDYVQFIAYLDELKKGSRDYFIVNLYYNDPVQSIDEVNIQCESIFDLKREAIKPYYADVFIKENEALTIENLLKWLKKIGYAFFNEDFNYIIANSESLESTYEEYKREF